VGRPLIGILVAGRVRRRRCGNRRIKYGRPGRSGELVERYDNNGASSQRRILAQPGRCIVKSMSPTQSVALMVNQIVSTIAVALLISLPWLLDGWLPPLERLRDTSG
jgi:hypothetical protein